MVDHLTLAAVYWLQATLIARRDELTSKHADALQLKDGIDRRRHHVTASLRRAGLGAPALGGYERFVQLRARLAIERQEIEDMIGQGEDQLRLIKASL